MVNLKGIGFVFGVTIYLEHDFIWLDKLQNLFVLLFQTFLITCSCLISVTRPTWIVLSKIHVPHVMGGKLTGVLLRSIVSFIPLNTGGIKQTCCKEVLILEI